MRFCLIIVNTVLVTYHMAVVKTNYDAGLYFSFYIFRFGFSVLFCDVFDK